MSRFGDYSGPVNIAQELHGIGEIRYVSGLHKGDMFRGVFRDGKKDGLTSSLTKHESLVE